MTSKWQSASRKLRCAICDHDSWCSRGELGWLCMRVQGGREILFKDGSIGWFYMDADARPLRPLPRRESIAPAPQNFCKLIELWSASTDPQKLTDFAARIGVTAWALGALGCCYSSTHGAWAFPMYDGTENVIGIRLRWNTGEKRAVTGSRNGLFIPEMESRERLYLAEGPTDTAAALSLGLWCIGRPSCSAGGQFIADLCRRLKVREVVILADADRPGIEGAERLSLPCRSAIVLPPAKDVRESVTLGWSLPLIEMDLNGKVWRQPA